MDQNLIKTRNGTIVLPKRLQRKWGNVTVYIVPSEDTLVIKKLETPLQRLSDIAQESKLTHVSQCEIEREIAAYRAS